MKLKGSCDCRADELTLDSWNNYLFKIIQTVNKYQKERWIVNKNGVITDLQKELITNERIIAKVKIGTKSVKAVEVLERPI